MERIAMGKVAGRGEETKGKLEGVSASGWR